MADYYCSSCGKACKPMLYPAGVGADCCEEAPLMVAFCPSYPDKCDGCERRPLYDYEIEELTADLMDDEGPQTPRDRWLGRS